MIIGQSNVALRLFAGTTGTLANEYKETKKREIVKPKARVREKWLSVSHMKIPIPKRKYYKNRKNDSIQIL